MANWRRTYHSPDRFLASEDHQCRNARHAKVLGYARVLINIEPGEGNFTLKLLGQRVNGWCDHPAGPAPVSIEIDEDKNIRLQDFLERPRVCVHDFLVHYEMDILLLAAI